MSTGKTKKMKDSLAEILNKEISLLAGDGIVKGNLTAGELSVLLSVFPKDARVVLQNFNAGNILAVGISAITPANLTWKEDERAVVQNDDGLVNTAIIGFWNEGNTEVELGPKQQAELDEYLAECGKEDEGAAAAQS
jgi:hypothetical protein